MIMPIQLRRVLIHNLLRRLHRIRMLQSRRPLQLIRLLLFRLILLLLLGMFIHKQIFNGALSRRSLVDDKGACKLPMRTDLDGVEEL